MGEGCCQYNLSVITDTYAGTVYNVVVVIGNSHP